MSAQGLLFDGRVESDALLSPCGTYRYVLRRTWDHSGEVVNFLMLNPSTADATVDDPTIRRCIRYARDWGYGGLVVTNLYALRATDPRDLWKHPAPIGPENDHHVIREAHDARLIVCAWGEHGAKNGRAENVLWQLDLEAITAMRCLKQNRSGQPVHPLYQPASALPVPLRASSTTEPE